MIIGIGLDLCDVERVRKLYERFGRRLVWRVLCEDEQAEAQVTAERLARRFAAKEAIAKALGCGIGGKLSFQDMSILRLPSGQPYVKFSEGAKRRFPNIKVHLSLTQERNMAGATAVVEKEGPAYA